MLALSRVRADADNWVLEVSPLLSASLAVAAEVTDLCVNWHGSRGGTKGTMFNLDVFYTLMHPQWQARHCTPGATERQAQLYPGKVC
jgi:hypothetical protein